MENFYLLSKSVFYRLCFSFIFLLSACGGGGGSSSPSSNPPSSSSAISSSSAASSSPTLSAPTISTNPTDSTVTSGNTATFSAMASGVLTPTVQWQVSTDSGASFTNVAGATATTLSFSSTLSQNGNQYRAVFSNASGTATTTVATLHVSGGFSITTSPTNTTVNAGDNVSFSAATTGLPTPTVQWQVSSDNGVSFTNVAGATSTTLSFVANYNQNAYQYRAVFTNAYVTHNTSTATLTVKSVLTLATSPSDQSVYVGDNVSFSASVTASPAATIQWQVSSDSGVSFTNLVGATANTLNFVANLSQNSNQYRAVFSNAGGTVNSSIAKLTVQQKQYSLGGIISGLTANGLVIANASDSLSIPANASNFTFAHQLTTGTNYTVSITTQPTGQNCSLTNATGVVASTNINNVQINCVNATAMTWLTPQKIESLVGSGERPHTGIDNQGNIIAVWTQLSGQYASVYASRYSNSTSSWSTPQLLSSGVDIVDKTQVALAVDKNGNAIAIWTQYVGSQTNTPTSIWVSQYNASGNTWGAPIFLAGETTNSGPLHMPVLPQIAFDQNGNASALWKQYSGNNNITPNLFVANYISGAWQVPHAITTSNDVGQGFISFDGQANATVIYTTITVVNLSAYVRLKSIRFDSGLSSWSAPVFISADNSMSINGTLSPAAVNSNGDAIAVWPQSDGTNDKTWASFFHANTKSWSAAQIVDSAIINDYYEPVAAIDANSKAIILWSNAGGIYSSTNAADTAWSTPKRIDAPPSAGRYPQVTVDANGNAFAVWSQFTLLPNSVSTLVWSNRYDATSGWSTPTQVETSGDISDTPQIVVDQNSKATAVWMKSNSVTDDIWSARTN